MRVNLDRGRGRSFDSIGVPIPGFNLYLRRFTLQWDEFLARIRYDKSATFRGKEKGTKIRIFRETIGRSRETSLCAGYLKRV